MKKKLLWISGILGTLGILYLCTFAAIFLDQALKNPEKISFETNPIQMFFYLRKSEITLLFMALFSVLTILGIITIWFSGTNKAYQSDLQKITPDIYTPVTAGQGQFGTAKWLKEKDFDCVFDYVILDSKKLLKKKKKLKQGGLVIGKVDLKNGKEKIYYIGKDRHSLNIGATRAGKTRSIVLQSVVDLMLAEENIFVVDMKKEIYDYTHKTAEELGYVPIRIDFIDPYQSDRKNYLEPIIKQLKHHDISRAIEETWTLVSQLVGEPPQNGEKLWNNGEAAIMAASIMAVAYDNQNRPEYQNLTNVFYFITEMCQDYKGALPLQFYIDSLDENHPSRILLAATKLAAFKTRSSFYVSAAMTLKLLTMPSINAMTNRSDFDLEELNRKNKKVIIYLCLPARDETYFPLASLTLRQVTDEIDRMADECGGRVPRRWNFIEDEFGNFTKITNITNQTSFGTGKGIRHNFFIQSFAQLNEKYGKEIAQIIRDNCDITIYLKSPNPETLKEISERLDKYTVSSYSINSNVQVGDITSRGSRGESVNLTGRELLRPGEVGKIQRPYSLVMTDADPAILYAPDLSQYAFNDFLGLGDEAFNQNLRRKEKLEQKKKERPHDEKLELWKIWDVFKRKIDVLIEEQERRKNG
jgi:type IV secretion system protein VirD4